MLNLTDTAVGSKQLTFTLKKVSSSTSQFGSVAGYAPLYHFKSEYITNTTVTSNKLDRALYISHAKLFTKMLLCKLCKNFSPKGIYSSLSMRCANHSWKL